MNRLQRPGVDYTRTRDAEAKPRPMFRRSGHSTCSFPRRSGRLRGFQPAKTGSPFKRLDEGSKAALRTDLRAKFADRRSRRRRYGLFLHLTRFVCGYHNGTRRYRTAQRRNRPARLFQVTPFHSAPWRHSLYLWLLFRLRRRRSYHHRALQFSSSSRRSRFGRQLVLRRRDCGPDPHLTRRSYCLSSLLRFVRSACQRCHEKISCAFEAGYFIIKLSDYFSPCGHAQSFYSAPHSSADSLPCGNWCP
jgi:hypothetical protein